MSEDEAWIAHKGNRFTVDPAEDATRVSPITKLDVMSPGAPISAEHLLLDEMTRAWERDWSDL